MKNRTKEAIVGFVSILAVTVLIVSIIYGKNLSLNTEKKEIAIPAELVKECTGAEKLAKFKVTNAKTQVQATESVNDHLDFR